MKRFNKKHCLILILILCAIFSIFLLGFFPGIIPYDGNNQWMQVQSGLITNEHPFFSTFFMYLLSKLWNNITVVIVYQILLFSFSWTYLCKTVNTDKKFKVWLIYIYTIIVMLIPLVSMYTITVWKDIIYTIYLFLCAIMLYEWSNNNYKFSVLKYSVLGVLLAMVFSYRHNGIIVAVLILLLFYVLCVHLYRKKIVTIDNFKKSFCTLIAFIIIFSVIQIPKKIMLNDSDKKLKNNEVTYSTVDWYMLWMMGSHITDNNIKNSDDKMFLNNIIPLDEWKNAYNAYLINNIGSAPHLDKEYLVKNDCKFRKMFIDYSLKNPLTIVKHYSKSDAILINPVTSIKGYVYVYPFPELVYLPEYTRIKPVLKQVDSFYIRLIDESLSKPFVLFYQPSIILFLSIIITVILAVKVYSKKIWLFSLPMILNTLSLLLINIAQDLRYVYINYLTFFGLLLMLILNLDKIFKRNSNK